MPKDYPEVCCRLLREEERLMLSDANELPLVIEATARRDQTFLNHFLSTHSSSLFADLAKYGAILLRGFDLHSEKEFENSVLSLDGFKGIHEGFMSEEGRVHVDNLDYVLFTNAVYKTGGTLYLGGFHNENYYTPDVPSYICFFCMQPSLSGGETGLINMEKVYEGLNDSLKERLEKTNFFVGKWLIQEAAERYQQSPKEIEQIARSFGLEIVGKGKNKFLLMYKPNVLKHPMTETKALHLNLFEIPSLNEELRKCFMQDYAAKQWFWHRLVWRLPKSALKFLEYLYIVFASFFYSPKESLQIFLNKLRHYKASRQLPAYDNLRVGSCFTKNEVKELAGLLRANYSSCLWQKGDILLIDNRKVAHAGMPGKGPRLIRAMIGNPVEMSYLAKSVGLVEPTNRVRVSLGDTILCRNKSNS